MAHLRNLAQYGYSPLRLYDDIDTIRNEEGSAIMNENKRQINQFIH